MINKGDQALEDALIDLVNKELTVIRSFCDAQFPCDVPSVIAVRMSRSIVAAICQINSGSTSRQQALFSEEGEQFLTDSLSQLSLLSKQFEQQIKQYPENDSVWKTWIG